MKRAGKILVLRRGAGDVRDAGIFILGILLGTTIVVLSVAGRDVAAVNLDEKPQITPVTASLAKVPAGWEDYHEYSLSVAQYVDGSVYVVARDERNRATFADYLTASEKAAFGMACLERWARETFTKDNEPAP